MKPNETETGERHEIKTKHGNWYLWVSPSSIMLTIPAENAEKNAEIRVLSEAMTRLASKGINAGMNLSDVAEQLVKADGGRKTIVGKVADVIAEYVECHRGNL